MEPPSLERCTIRFTRFNRSPVLQTRDADKEVRGDGTNAACHAGVLDFYSRR